MYNYPWEKQNNIFCEDQPVCIFLTFHNYEDLMHLTGIHEEMNESQKQTHNSLYSSNNK